MPLDAFAHRLDCRADSRAGMVEPMSSTPRRVRESASEDGWYAYLEAAQRKILIARYHSSLLRSALTEQPPGASATIPVQASFEGMLSAMVSAADQVAEGINIAYACNLDKPTLADVIHFLPQPLRRRFGKWHQKPVAADVRDIRRLIVHHHHAKTPDGPMLVVQEPSSARPYGGSREIGAYADAVVAHCLRFSELIDSLESLLRSTLSTEAR
jgi:hypothetical protein